MCYHRFSNVNQNLELSQYPIVYYCMGFYKQAAQQLAPAYDRGYSQKYLQLENLTHSLLQTDMAKAKAGLDVRFWGLIACVKASHKYIRPGGSVTLTSGTVALRPIKDWAIASGEHSMTCLVYDCGWP